MLQQQVLEHLLAEIVRPALGHVLQVARTVHEQHRRMLLRRVVIRRLVILRPDVEMAVAARNLHELRLDPVHRLVLRAARVGEFVRTGAVDIHHRQLRRDVGGRVRHGEPAAVGRQHERHAALGAAEALVAGNALQIATRGRQPVGVVGIGRLLVGEHVEPLAVRRHDRARYLVAGAGQCARLAVQRLDVQLRPATGFGFEPQRAVVGQPAEFVEAPVDPGRIGQPVLCDQLVIGEIDAGDPAVLVVDRAQLDRQLAAVVAPCDAAATAVVATGHDAYQAHVGRLQRCRLVGLAVLLQRGHRLLAQGGQRIVLDAGQPIGLQCVLLVMGQVEQPQRLRRRVIAADVVARVLRLGVAAVGHVMIDLRRLALLVSLRRGHQQQPAAVWRQLAVDQPDLVAQPERRRRAPRVGRFQRLALIEHGLLVGLDLAQGLEQLQLQPAQIIRLLRLRVVGELQFGDRRGHAAGQVVAVPVVAVAILQRAAIGGKLRRRLVLRRDRHLAAPAAGQIHLEHVAVQDEGSMLVRMIEHGRPIGLGHRGRIEFHAVAAGRIDPVQVAHRAAVALERVVQAAPVHAPVRILHRLTDPVGIGHDGFQVERSR